MSVLLRYSGLHISTPKVASYVITGAIPWRNTSCVARNITNSTVSDDEFDEFSSKVVYMFPGQGSQYVGMCSTLCQDFPVAKVMFEKASHILGYNLLQRCTDGPKDVLDTTEVSQPAIFVASMAAVETLLQEEGLDAKDSATCAMGISLGEYSALCFSGALSFEDGVTITHTRGLAMQAASDAVDTGMVSVIGLDKIQVQELCDVARDRSGKDISIANYLCPGNYSVSGHSKACQVLVDIAKPEFKAHRTIPLTVSGAFHTEFMAPAVSELENCLDTIDIHTPRIPVISNVDAKPHSDPVIIKKLLVTQVTSPVLWEHTMDNILHKDFERAVGFGPGNVAITILKRFHKTANCKTIEV